MDGLRVLRRITVWTVVVSLSIAALTGIFVILSGSSGDLEGRVMATASAVGVAASGVPRAGGRAGRRRLARPPVSVAGGSVRA